MDTARFLHRFSGFWFYVLGTSFIAAELMRRNDLYATESAWWLQVADMPLIACALLYAGTGFYGSMGKATRMTAWITGIPLAIVFALLVTLNFWPR